VTATALVCVLSCRAARAQGAEAKDQRLELLARGLLLAAAVPSRQTVGMRMTGLRLADSSKPGSVPGWGRVLVFASASLALTALLGDDGRPASDDEADSGLLGSLRQVVRPAGSALRAGILLWFLARRGGRASTPSLAMLSAGLTMVAATSMSDGRPTPWAPTSLSMTAESPAPPPASDAIVRARLVGAASLLLAEIGRCIDWDGIWWLAGAASRGARRAAASAATAAVSGLGVASEALRGTPSAPAIRAGGSSEDPLASVWSAGAEALDSAAMAIQRLGLTGNPAGAGARDAGVAPAEPKEAARWRADGLKALAATGPGRAALEGMRCGWCGGEPFRGAAVVGPCGHPACYACAVSAAEPAEGPAPDGFAAGRAPPCGVCGEVISAVVRVG